MDNTTFHCPLCGKMLTLMFDGRTMWATCDEHDWVIHYEADDSSEIASIEYIGESEKGGM